MITPSFGLTATERVLPKLALDFTTASIDSRVTFTRTTDVTHPATYVNSSGTITLATNNEPRFDYAPVTLACKGLLIEESRTNQFTYSNTFDNAAWNKTRCSANPNAALSPDGTNNAYSLIEDNTAGNTHYFYYNTITWAAGTYTNSFYIKSKSGNRRVTFYQGYGGVVGSYVTFDPDTGTIAGTSGSATGTMTAAGNGWYRCTITYTTTTTTARFDVMLIPNNQLGNQGYNGDGTSGIYIWGAQLEAGAFATSYIPTTSAALTRNADVAKMTGTNFSDWFNASEGTFETQFTSNGYVANEMLFSASPGDLSALIQAYWSGASTISADGGVSASMSISGAQNTASKFVYAYKLNNYAMSINAATPSTDSSGTPPNTLSQLNIGHRNGSLVGNQHIRKFLYWSQRITNAEVQSFSK